MPQTRAIAIRAMLPNLYLIFAIIISTPHVHPALVRQLRSASVWFSHCPYAFLPPSSHLTRQCVGFPPLTNCGLWSRAVAISSASITHTDEDFNSRHGLVYAMAPSPLHPLSFTQHSTRSRPHYPPPHHTHHTWTPPQQTNQGRPPRSRTWTRCRRTSKRGGGRSRRACRLGMCRLNV